MANSLFLAYVMEFNRPGNEAYYARIARRLGAARPGADDAENARCAVRFVEELIQRLEIPAFASFSGVDPADFEDLARRAAESPMSLDNRKTIGKGDYLRILQDAYQGKKMYL